jgi:hypothetical protein
MAGCWPPTVCGSIIFQTTPVNSARFSDIITELMSATNLDWQFVPNQLKRTLEVDEDHDYEQPPVDDDGESSQAAGVHRVPLLRPDMSSGLSIADIDPLFMLPKYTEDLGRLPVYEPFNWTKESQGTTYPNEYPIVDETGTSPLCTSFSSIQHIRGPIAELPAEPEAALTETLGYVQINNLRPSALSVMF